MTNLLRELFVFSPKTNCLTTQAVNAKHFIVAIGASGGKDSAVLAKVLQVLNERHDYGQAHIYSKHFL